MLYWCEYFFFFFFFKQKTAYEMRISDWSSDVCSSDLRKPSPLGRGLGEGLAETKKPRIGEAFRRKTLKCQAAARSEEHTSEPQSLMRISYAVFCLKKKNNSKRVKHKIETCY